MGQARDEAGNIWETDAAGNAVRLVQAAQMPRGPAPITIGRPDPMKPLEMQAKQADIANDAERLRLARENQGLAAEASRRAAEKDARDRQTLDARGGAETTESERTAAFLATRVAGGLRDLRGIGNVGAPSLKDATIGGTMLGNYATDEARQRTINAQRDVLDAALTLGTGAAYTKEQIEAYRASYFPQPGDQPKTIEDKQRRLQTLMSAARVKAGAAASQIDAALQGTDISAGENGNPLNADQQKLYDAYLASNPQATAEQLRTFAKTAGLGEVQNADEVINARQSGAGVAPASAAQMGPRGSYNDSILSQGLSGVNEGIASTLGAPVDLVNSALGLGAQGINALANTDLAVSDNPFLGSDWWKNKFQGMGAIGAEADHPFARRVGQSVGAAAVPGMGAARTGGQVAAALLSGLGGGIGAATAQQIAPGNALAEIGGELAGGGISGMASLANGRRLAQREIEAAVPTVPQLKEQAADLYRQAEQNGVTAYTAQVKDLQSRISKILTEEGTISPTGRISEVHPKVKEAYATIGDYAGPSVNSLPSSQYLNTPRTPTPQEMASFSSLENVPLSAARSGQSAQVMDWQGFNNGKPSTPLVKGFEENPVVVRLENGEYIVLDGNHRATRALNQGAKTMPMHVIPAKAYDPANAGYTASKSGMSDDDILAELGGADAFRGAAPPVATDSGFAMNPTQMQTVRSILSDGRMSAEPKEARIANMLTDEFDNWTAPLAPELSDARAVASRYLNAQTLERARELAEARASQFSGSGLENAIRTEYRGLDRQAIRGQQPGMIDPVVEQIENVSRGTAASNAARALGRLAPRGVVSAGLSTGVPFTIGSSLGGPALGAALSGTTVGLGEAGRRIATHLADRGATVAELIARNGGALDQAPLLTPEIARLLAAQVGGQGSQYLDDRGPNGY